jgi:RNA polymerase sigma factor (sigma-70 family)
LIVNELENTVINQDALVRMFLSQRVRLLAYIRSIVRNSDSAEDIFQNVCVIALQNREVIVGEDHLKSWMRVVAKREAIDFLRSRRSAMELSEDVIESLEGTWLEHDTENDVRIADFLRQCLRLLSKPHQELIRKRFEDRYDYEQLAREVGRPVNSLYVTFSRIYRKLNECIHRHFVTEHGGDYV